MKVFKWPNFVWEAGDGTFWIAIGRTPSMLSVPHYIEAKAKGNLRTEAGYMYCRVVKAGKTHLFAYADEPDEMFEAMQAPVKTTAKFLV